MAISGFCSPLVIACDRCGDVAVHVSKSPPQALDRQPADYRTMLAGSMKNKNPSEPPLWSIGIAMAIILLAPLLLYSLAPTGPIREGDTVFSEGEQRVGFSTSITGTLLNTNDTCLLDPNSPLIVTHVPSDQSDQTMRARVQGNPSGEWPFCPLHAEVRFRTHQVFQKPVMFSAVREMLVGRE